MSRPERPQQPVTRRRRAARRRAAVQLGLVRVGLRSLELVSPRAAGRRAFALWCRLPANAGRRKDFRPAPGTLHHLTAARGGRLVAESWGEGPVVYLVHGWGGWRGQLGAFVEPLVAAGYRVVAVDAPGHGDSGPGLMGPGKGTLIEIVEALEVAGAQFGEAAGVVAHSVGCTAAAMAVHETLPARRLVLVAPNHDFGEITADFVGRLGLSARTRQSLHDAVETLTGRSISDFDLEPLGADGTLPPTLVVHDREDKETPYRVGAGIAAAWPDARLVTTEGLGHQRILADVETVDRVVAHISQRVPAGS